MVLSLKSTEHKICVREDGDHPGVQDKKWCGLEENYPLPKPQHANPFFSPVTSSFTPPQHPLTPRDPHWWDSRANPALISQQRFPLSQHSLLVGIVFSFP